MTRNRDFVAALIVCAVSGASFYLAGNYASEAQIFPRLVAGIMFVCGIAILGRAFLKAAIEEEQIDRRVLIIVGMTVIYIFAIPLIGYVAATILFIPAVSYWLGLRRVILIGAVTVLIAFTVSYVFSHLFLTPLPAGSLWTQI